MPECQRTHPWAGDPSGLTPCLLALAIITLILGVCGSVIVAVGLCLPGAAWTAGLTTAMLMVLPLAGGCVSAGVLWAAAYLCRWQYRQSLLQERIASALAAAPGAGPGEPGEEPLLEILQPGPAPDEQAPAPGLPPAPAKGGIGASAEANALLEELRELNINLLLSDAQRQLKRQYLTERQAGALAGQIEQASAGGNWRQGSELLDRLVRLVPDWGQLPDVRRRVEQARVQAEARDVESATRRASDFMAAGQFDQAAAAASELLALYPGLPAAAALLQHVQRERAALTGEQRLRMYQRVEKEAAGRHWRAALVAAQELLAAHPECPEADAVRAQLQTLKDNANLEEARELRDRIRDLISRRRFAEALEVARDLIHRFPTTAAAEELRQQLSRLEELAKTQPHGGA